MYNWISFLEIRPRISLTRRAAFVSNIFISTPLHASLLVRLVLRKKARGRTNAARGSRDEEVDSRHTRERIIRSRGAWWSMNKSGSIRLFLSCLRSPLITNRAFGERVRRNGVNAISSVQRNRRISDGYRSRVGAKDARPVFHWGGPVSILRDSALAKGRSIATLPHRFSTQSTSDFRIWYLTSFFFLVDLCRPEVRTSIAMRNS